MVACVALVDGRRGRVKGSLVRVTSKKCKIAEIAPRLTN
jgi:hypothetical protein